MLCVLPVLELADPPAMLAALLDANDCALFVKLDRRPEAADELLPEDVASCAFKAVARSPAFDSNCCRLMELPPFDICANNEPAAADSSVPLALLRKLVSSLWLILPSPLVSMLANSFSSDCARPEAPLALFVLFALLAPNSEETRLLAMLLIIIDSCLRTVPGQYPPK